MSYQLHFELVLDCIDFLVAVPTFYIYNNFHFFQVHVNFILFQYVFFYVMKVCNEKVKIEIHGN